MAIQIEYKTKPFSCSLLIYFPYFSDAGGYLLVYYFIYLNFHPDIFISRPLDLPLNLEFLYLGTVVLLLVCCVVAIICSVYTMINSNSN